MITYMMISFLVLLLLGMPVAFAMGIAAALTVYQLESTSLLLIPQRLFMSLNSFPLLAIPFFVLAGELMNAGGITRRLVQFATALLRHLRGSLAHVNVVTNMIMAGFSGSATADCIAIGSVMIPAMKEEGYPPAFTAGLTAAASCIGPIIPPSIAMIIYGSITGLSVGAMFLGGFIPGICIGLGLMFLVHVVYARKYSWPRGEKAGWSEIASAARGASLALLAPVIILGGIITGVTTATEAGVVAVVYAFFIGVVVYKEIPIKKIPEILRNAAINTAVPVLIIACASIFGWVLARENFTGGVDDVLSSITTNPDISYFLIICMLLVVGCFVEGTAALLIFVPVLFPLGSKLGYDPIHFALVIIITILIGTITPPVGLQLYIASSISRVPISEVVVWPFVAIMVAVLLIITYVPILVTFLPSLVFAK